MAYEYDTLSRLDILDKATCKRNNKNLLPSYLFHQVNIYFQTFLIQLHLLLTSPHYSLEDHRFGLHDVALTGAPPNQSAPNQLHLNAANTLSLSNNYTDEVSSTSFTLIL